MRARFGFVSDDAPALLLGGIDLLALGTQAGAAAGFNVLSYNPTLSLKGNARLYTDASQASPVAAWGDQIQQWRDERETAGQNNYPYGAQTTAANRPTYAPQAFSGVGGVQFTNQRLQLNGLSGIDISNCTLIVTGVLFTDFAQNQSPGFINVGTVAGGMTLMGGGIGTSSLNLFPDANYGSADHTATALSVPVGPYTVLSLQSTGSGVVLDVNGTDAAASAAASAGTVSNGYVGDWSNQNIPCYRAFLGRVLVFSPALSGANLTAVLAGLQGEAALNSLYPLGYPLLAFWGNSLTVGVGHGGITAAQSYPYQCLAGLSVSAGYLLAAVSGKTTSQLDAAFSAALDSHYKASGRTGAQVFIGWELANDIGTAGLTGAQAYSGYKAFFQNRKNTGWKAILFDCMNNGGFTAGQQTAQANCNTSLKADFTASTGKPHVLGPAGGITYGDYLLDVQADPRLQTTGDTTYFSDGTHLTVAGYAVIAGYVQDALALLGVTSAWTPAQDASVVAWYTADSGLYKDTSGTTAATADGDAVALWKDQTGNHRDLSQATAGNRPVLKLSIVNGQPVVRFARASSQWLASAAFTLNQPLTVLIVAKFADNTQSYLVDGITVNKCVLTNFPTDSAHVRMYAGASFDNACTPGNWNLYRCAFNGASSKFSANAATAATGNPGTNGLDGLTLGAQGDHAGAFLQGDVAAVLLCNSATPDERILNWLNAKYALF